MVVMIGVSTMGRGAGMGKGESLTRDSLKGERQVGEESGPMGRQGRGWRGSRHTRSSTARGLRGGHYILPYHFLMFDKKSRKSIKNSTSHF